DHWRNQRPAAAYGQQPDLRLRVFGLHRVSVPRFSLAALAADLFCKHLVGQWCGRAASWEEKRTGKELPFPLRALGLDAESVRTQLHGAALRVFGEDPEQSFLKIVADSPFDRTSLVAQTSSAASAQEALAKID